MKIRLRLSLILTLLVIFLTSISWQSATVTETSAAVSSTGFDGYPQIGLFLILQVVGLFGARYWGNRTAKIAGTLVALVSALAIMPIASVALSGDVRLLQHQVEKLTGIADWESQVSILNSLETNTSVIFGIFGSMIALLLVNLISALSPREAKPDAQREWLN